jgi:sulfur carrier protein
MEAFINNQPFPLSGLTTLSDVLMQQDFLDKKGIAVAVNNSVVPKAEWNTYEVKSADKITIIRATQGG